MKPRDLSSRFSNHSLPGVLAVGLTTLLVANLNLALAQQTSPPAAQSQAMNTTASTQDFLTPKIPPEQLESLVAPIALYSDTLLAQTLAASTYPLEIIQLSQWAAKNPNLQGQPLADAVAKQNWDPSVQSLAASPDLLQRMSENIQWTTDLGNAFLAQQQDVMDAVQRMRAKAQGKGTLKTSQQQVVKTEQVNYEPTGGGGGGGGSKQVIVIQDATPDV